MACNPNQINCNSNSPGMDWYNAAAESPECSQFFDPSNFQAEQVIYDAAYQDMINSFGIPIDYYINTFNLSAADTLYGEQPTAIFYGPVSLQMYVELTEPAVNLSKFGFASDDEMTGFLHIQTFMDAVSGKRFYIRTSTGNILSINEYFSQNKRAVGINDTLMSQFTTNGQVLEPKSGDLIQLSPLGCDRPNGRGAKIFEVTERVDQDVASLNPLMGHYVYRLRAKRYEYSFEPGAPQEQQNQQVFENAFSGKKSSTITGQVSSAPKSYPGDVDTESQTKVFDMTANETDIYGTYY